MGALRHPRVLSRRPGAVDRGGVPMSGPRTPLPPRRTPLARGGKPNARRSRTAVETRAKHEHDYGPTGFVEWIREQPSVASGKGPCEAAHTEIRGAKLKGHWTTIVPLTRQEHIGELHQSMGQQTFQRHYGIDLQACAADTLRRWLAHCASTGEP